MKLLQVILYCVSKYSRILINQLKNILLIKSRNKALVITMWPFKFQLTIHKEKYMFEKIHRKKRVQIRKVVAKTMENVNHYYCPK